MPIKERWAHLARTLPHTLLLLGLPFLLPHLFHPACLDFRIRMNSLNSYRCGLRLVNSMNALDKYRSESFVVGSKEGFHDTNNWEDALSFLCG